MNLPSNVWDGKVVAGPNGCLLWIGALGRGRDAYGYIWNNGKTRKTHRLMYEQCYGVIPEGMMILHKCNVKRCVNPLHLYAGTQKDNMRDYTEAGGHSEEIRANISKVHSGKIVSQETRAKLSNAFLGKTRAVVTPEIRAKLDRHNVLQRIRRDAQKIQVEPDTASVSRGECR